MKRASELQAATAASATACRSGVSAARVPMQPRSSPLVCSDTNTPLCAIASAPESPLSALDIRSAQQVGGDRRSSNRQQSDALPAIERHAGQSSLRRPMAAAM